MTTQLKLEKEIRIRKIQLKLEKEIKKNPNFVFWDYENECIADDLLEFIYKIKYQKQKNDN